MEKEKDIFDARCFSTLYIPIRKNYAVNLKHNEKQNK